MEVPSESFKGELGIEEPVILCEPRILTVNQWLADTKTHDSNKEKDETRIDYKEVTFY